MYGSTGWSMPRIWNGRANRAEFPGRRWVCSAGGMAMIVCAVALYGFGSIAEHMWDHLLLSSYQQGLLALCENVGQSIGSFTGGIVAEGRGPTLGGAMLFFLIGYGGIRLLLRPGHLTPPNSEWRRSLPVICRTAVRTQLRAAAALNSDRCGVLEADQLILVLEERWLDSGSAARPRVRVGRLSKKSEEDLGWLSAETARGEPILVPLSATEAAAAWRWRGLKLAERQSSHDEAVAAFGQAWVFHEAEIDRAPTTSAKLRHDAEQLEWLVAQRVLTEAGTAAADLLRETERQLFAGADGKSGEVARIPPATLEALRGWYRTTVHVAPAGRIAGGALGDVDWVRTAAEYWATGPTSCVVVDDVLSTAALDALVRYCRESTVFDDFLYKGGYIGTSLTNGLGTALVLQIAAELRVHLPSLLAEHSLRHAWVYKCDSTENASAIAPHADEAAVNVNIWLVDGWQNSRGKAGPVERCGSCNSGSSAAKAEDGGGLRVWLKQVPVDFDFQAYNRQPAKLLHWIDNSPEAVRELTIPHRVNRAVIFNSALVHQSDVPPGAMRGCGFENRRMNLTLLFGER